MERMAFSQPTDDEIKGLERGIFLENTDCKLRTGRRKSTTAIGAKEKQF
jgi:hypothetical protein